MRHASTYRGARRNTARARIGGLRRWRLMHKNVDAANSAAHLDARAAMANSAREAAAKALVEHGVLGYRRQADVLNDALLGFYSNVKPPRSRVVNRIIRDLSAAKRRAA